MGLTFGIDLGIASCGWAVLRQPEGDQPGEIVALGSWMFDKPETAKEKTPTNQLRRGARLLRRVIRRRRNRMAALRRLFVQHGLLASSDPDALKRLDGDGKSLDPWELRAKALDKVLAPAELAVALGHVAKRRGFKSNAKRKDGANAASDDSKMLKAIEATKERAGRYRTIGEMFARDPAYARKRNRDGNFDRTMSRDEQAAEVRAIFEAQRRLGNASASDELQAAFEQEAFFQRPLQDSERLVEECLFEPGEKRAAKLAPSFERFRLLTRLVTLRVVTPDGEVPLNPEQIEAAVGDFGKTAKLSGTEVRKRIGLPVEHRFLGMKPEDEKNDVAARTVEAMAGSNRLRKVLGEDQWSAMSAEQLDRIAHVVTFFETAEKIEKELAKLGLPAPALDALTAGVAAGQFAKFNGAGHISAKAARNLVPLLAKGLRYDQACEQVGYDHAATRWGKSPQIVDKAGFNRLVRDMGEEIANPVARKAMTEGLKQLWAMRNRWGLPDAIHIELARDVGNSLEERNKITKRLNDTTAQRERERNEAREALGREDIGGETLLRYRLWKEQGNRCLYTDTYIDPRQLIASDNSVQVDHILPWSRFGDDSFNNKTLCLASANQKKRGATPFEWFSRAGMDWDSFTARVERSAGRGFKKRNYLLKSAKEAEEKFRTRNLNDTRYAARALAEAAKLFFPPDRRMQKDGTRAVYTRPGALTAALRQAWGVEALKKVDGKRVDDARHHALDAVVVAAVGEAEVQKLTKSFQEWEQQGLGRKIREVPEPWDGFRRQLTAMYDDKNHLFVARAERRRARGEGHAATIRQVVERDGAVEVYERKSVEKLTEADLPKIKDADRNGALVASLRDWIARGKPMTALPRSPNDDEIRKVRVLAKGKPAVRVRGGTADRGEMVRVDVFTKANKKGKDEFYLVPIYPHQVMDRSAHPTPPMRASVAYKDEPDWVLMDGSYAFQFSLYQRTYVELKKSGGEDEVGYFCALNRHKGAIDLFAPEDPGNKRTGIGAKTLLTLRKFNVDRFGRRSEVKGEVRTWHGVACTSPNPPG